jgi:D-alanine-D-alanine ligase
LRVPKDRPPYILLYTRTMKRKIRVAILFGGKSAEHEVSLRSAKNVAAALDPKKYDVTELMIPKTGTWKISSEALARFDVIFPVLHGPFGEDGTVQGLLKLANVAFVGPGVLGSAVGMDKDIARRLLRDAGIPIGKFLTVTKTDPVSFKDAKKKLGIPLFIKPANLGSSVGVYKVKTEKEFDAAIKSALKFDTKVLIEEFIKGREVECAVLGNENPRASVVGEIIPHHEFYSYEAKYLDENGAGLEIPAKIPKKVEKRIQELAIKTFKTLACEGMSRVDFFLKDNGPNGAPFGGEVVINEINTIPGFTSISMYPKLWEASGIPPKRLVDTLISLAIARFKRDAKLKTSY